MRSLYQLTKYISLFSYKDKKEKQTIEKLSSHFKSSSKILCERRKGIL